MRRFERNRSAMRCDFSGDISNLSAVLGLGALYRVLPLAARGGTAAR
jgi:hypothetical protein